MAKEKVAKSRTPKKADAEKIKVEDLAQEEETVTMEDVKPTRKKREELDRNMLVEVMNNTNGTYVHTSRRSGQSWVFDGYGARDEMELQELLSIRAASAGVLNEPILLILDDEVVEYLGLGGLYEDILNDREVDLFFKLRPSEMEDILEKAPEGMKKLLCQKALEKVGNGELDSVARRRVFENVFGIELDD